MTTTEVAPVARTPFDAGFEEYAAGDLPRLGRLAAMLAPDRDSAHDLVQETLVKVGVAWPRVRCDGNPAAYANTTMSRLAWRMKERATKERSLLLRHRVTTSVPAETHRIDDASELGAAMQALGSRQRAVLVLRFYCDLSVAETAATLGCSESNVKSQTARGLTNLRAHLTSSDKEH